MMIWGGPTKSWYHGAGFPMCLLYQTCPADYPSLPSTLLGLFIVQSTVLLQITHRKKKHFLNTCKCMKQPIQFYPQITYHLEQHTNGVFDVRLECLKPLRPNGTVHYPVITAQCNIHKSSLFIPSILSHHDSLFGATNG